MTSLAPPTHYLGASDFSSVVLIFHPNTWSPTWYLLKPPCRSWKQKVWSNFFTIEEPQVIQPQSDLFGMVSSRDPFTGESWTPTRWSKGHGLNHLVTVNCWFGLLFWNPMIPLILRDKGLLFGGGTMIKAQTNRPQTKNQRLARQTVKKWGKIYEAKLWSDIRSTIYRGVRSCWPSHHEKFP